MTNSRMVGGVADLNRRKGPLWLPRFLRASYFSRCWHHGGEKNHFCIDCNVGPLCPHGLREHAKHKTLQVRKASHSDSIRISDVQKLLDIGEIQTYVINGAKIVFLMPRPQRIMKDSAKTCLSCGRGLQDFVHFCSIGCKLDVVKNFENDASVTLSMPGKEMEVGSGAEPLREILSGVERMSAIPPYSCCDDDHIGGDVQQSSLKKKRQMKEKRRSPDVHVPPMKKRQLIFDASKGRDDTTAAAEGRVACMPWTMESCNQRQEATPQHKPKAMAMALPSLSSDGSDSPPAAPNTPPSKEDTASFRAGHKRKGVPHRAPLC